MKKLIIAFAAMALLPLHVHADEVADAYKLGLAAMEEGDVQGARAAFNAVLKKQPGHANARYQLETLNRDQGSIAAIARRKKLEKVVLEQIDFNNVEASQAISALAMLVEKKTEKQFSPNFMVRDPSNVMAGRTVNLQLKNIPAAAVLKMIMDQANAMVRYEEHAIVISPRGGNEAATVPATQPGGKSTQPVKENKADPFK